MSSIRSRLNRGDHVVVEKIDGFSTVGRFVAIDDEFIVVKGTVAQMIGQEVFIPITNVSQIIISKKVSDDD